MYYGGFVWNIIITLRHCLGEDWTRDIKEAWTIAVSYMLRTIVPVAARGTRHFASPYIFPQLDGDQGSECEITVSAPPPEDEDDVSLIEISGNAGHIMKKKIPENTVGDEQKCADLGETALHTMIVSR